MALGGGSSRDAKPSIIGGGPDLKPPVPRRVVVWFVRVACCTRSSSRQSRGRAGRAASARRSGLSSDSPDNLRLSGLVARRATRFAPFGRCARTGPTSQKRAALKRRGHETGQTQAPSPDRCGAACPATALRDKLARDRLRAHMAPRGRRYPAGAICGAAVKTGLGPEHALACHVSDSPRLSERSAASAQILSFLSSQMQLHVERFARAQDTVGYLHQLAHQRTQDHHFGFARCAQSACKCSPPRRQAHADQRGHVQGAA